ncbi:transposase [Actinomadura sp. 21ATH]|uniref:transposase n=1 Tax=Actinomadura sp. 21ATH TaxID=1735444 RepID=UPI0035C0CBA2
MGESLLPAPKRPGRPSRWPRRQHIDGIRRRVRAGAPWRDVPARYARPDRKQRGDAGSWRRHGRRLRSGEVRTVSRSAALARP